MKNDTILIASDHGGYKLKEYILALIKDLKIPFTDLGTKSLESVDYPDFAHELASSVSKGQNQRGILICGTGIGMSITANRYKNVRATLCHNVFTAQMSREHNNSNILVMGERVLDFETAKEILSAWLNTDFGGGRHQKRLDKIDI